MHLEAQLRAPCAPDDLFAWVDDLERYPRWLDIVAGVRPVDADTWEIDLRAKVGPLARSKRLRMVRTTMEPPNLAVFERREVDGRDHSPWRLEAEVRAVDDGQGSSLAMRLSYGGGLFGSVIERILRDEIERSKPRLLALAVGEAA